MNGRGINRSHEHIANENPKTAPAGQADGWECRRHLWSETCFENQNVLKIFTAFPAVSLQVVSRKPRGRGCKFASAACPSSHARVTSSEEMSTISKNRLGSDLGCKAYTEHWQFYLEVSLVADGRSLVADTVMIGSTGYYKTPQEFSYCFHRVGSFCIFTGTRSVELTELQESTLKYFFLYALLFSNKNVFYEYRGWN